MTRPGRPRGRQSPAATAGGLMIATLILFAGLLPPALSLDPVATDLAAAWAPPAPGHPLGCDGLGRDILARLVAATGHSLLVSALVSGLSGLAGALLGAAAGLLGSWLDSLIMRLVDLALAFPGLALAVLVTLAAGPGSTAVVIAVVLAWMPEFAVLARTLARQARSDRHILAATALGAGPGHILLRHILPALLPPLAMRAAAGTGAVIMYEASLCFLGLGPAEPAATLGGLLNDGVIGLRINPTLGLTSAATIALLCLAFNLLAGSQPPNRCRSHDRAGRSTNRHKP